MSHTENHNNGRLIYICLLFMEGI